MDEKAIKAIQQLYKSDMRSMINFMQSNQNNTIESGLHIIDNEIWQNLYDKFGNREKLEKLIIFVQQISMDYNIDKKNIIKYYLNYIIRNKPHIVTQQFLIFVENIMHFQDCKNVHYINYSLTRLSSFIPKF
jgi:DNA polymerase III delta prime subunit